MRNLLKLAGALGLVLAPAAMFGAAELKAPDVTVGRALQTSTTVRLPEPSPADEFEVTLKVDDPKKALLSRRFDEAGSASLTLPVKKGFYNTPEFFVQGIADKGTASYTITASGMGEGKGKITLVPSAIAILGPFKQAGFSTTPRGVITKLTLVAATLDSSMKVDEEQQIAGGSKITVRIDSTRPEVGKLGESSLTLKGGESTAVTTFTAGVEGKTTLSLTTPGTFRKPADFSSVDATVQMPGVAVADELTIGKDLQMSGIICLGDPAPADGLDVTLTSSDPSKLVLSTKEDELGSGKIIVHVPAGALTHPYYLQSLSDSGMVTYSASAPGYRPRVAQTTLAPSGMIVGFSQYGPPDEAAVLRRVGAHEERGFYASLEGSKKTPIHLTVWSAYLDHGLAADITVQGLRPGISATINLTSSNPAVGTVESPVTLHSGAQSVTAVFTPVSLGQSIITIDTPAGFSRPKNAVAVPGNVMK